MEKRLFFGMGINSIWPSKYPKGKLISENNRHLTLSFLGSNDYEKINQILKTFPRPPFHISKCGIFDKCIFLPEKTPNVVSWHIEWFDGVEIEGYVKEISNWLKNNNIKIHNENRKFLSHVTIARKPENIEAWEKSFVRLPVVTKNINLYESLGNSNYNILWTYNLLQPFEEIEHTADLAFIIRGKNLLEIYNNAKIALSFKFYEIINYFSKEVSINSIEDVMVSLNDIISKADQNTGCPFKAVSLHGDLKKDKNGIYSWEMLIDV